MKLWGNKIIIVEGIQRMKGTYHFQGNFPAMFSGTFHTIEEAKDTLKVAERIKRGPRCNSGFYQGGMTWIGKGVA